MVIAPTWPEFDLSLVAMSGLSWLLVLQSTLRGFSPGSLVLPSPQKSTFPNSSLIGCWTTLILGDPGAVSWGKRK